jgi:hypothetical protein
MNITTQARFTAMLMLTATVAIATASAAPDQAAAVQVTPTHYVIRSATSTTHSTQAPQQQIALLNVPATTAQSQADIWNDPQPAPSPQSQVPAVKNPTPDDESLVLPVVSVHSRPTVIKYLSKLVLSPFR